jgi:TRAP-type C4-dicarboxylate transport system permease small subunit
MHWLLRFVRLFERLAVGLALLGALSLGCVALITVVDVGIRPFGRGIRGVVDYVQLFVISGVFLAMPYTFFADGHVRVQLVLDLLPARIRNAVLIVVTMVTIAFLVILVVRTHDSFLDVAARRDRTLNIALPMTWFWTPMLVGLALSIVTTFALLLKQVFGIDAPGSRREEANGAR